jgi:hypothetical protein
VTQWVQLTSISTVYSSKRGLTVHIYKLIAANTQCAGNKEVCQPNVTTDRHFKANSVLAAVKRGDIMGLGDPTTGFSVEFVNNVDSVPSYTTGHSGKVKSKML